MRVNIIKDTGKLETPDGEGLEPGEIQTGGTYTDYILEVVGPTQLVTKDTTVSVTKKIREGDKLVDANTVGSPSGDRKGDKVTYELISEVPDYTAYTSDFYFVMNDTFSTGLDFNNDVKITIGGKEVTRGGSADITTGNDEDSVTEGVRYIVYNGTTNEVIEKLPDDAIQKEAMLTALKAVKAIKIAFVNLDKETVGDEIIVNYSATLNTNAIIGSTGNTNKVNLTYSTNPNFSHDGKTNVDGKPGIPDTTTKVPLGKTPDSVVVTYVTQLVIYKTQMKGGSEVALPGAEFTLTGFSTETVLKGGTAYVRDDANGTHYLLKDGTYTIDAPDEVATVKQAATGATAGYVLAEEGYTGDDARTVEGKKYRPYKKDSDVGPLYVIVEPNDSLYASTTNKYREVTNENTKTTKYVKMTATSGKNGMLVFKGLGEGTYTITETKTPAGFNTADPITFTISGNVIIGNNEVALGDAVISTGTEPIKWTGDGVVEVRNEKDANYTESANGEYYTKILNQKGSLLPSTGGIGTTIFYVVGGILVIGAGILLVTKKRMGRN